MEYAGIPAISGNKWLLIDKLWESWAEGHGKGPCAPQPYLAQS